MNASQMVFYYVQELLPSSLTRCHCSPFCHLRDIFPRPGEVFLMEGGFGNTAKFPFSPEAPSPRELSSICETEGVYRSTTLPTSAGEAGTMPRTALSVLRWTVKVTLRPAAKSGW